jgi:hypothetical protein
MDNLHFYIFLIALIVLFESIAQFHIKKSRISNNIIFLFVGILAYTIVCLLLKKCYEFETMGITNFVWSILSIVSIILIGLFSFNESVTKYDIIGIGICIIGLYFIFIKDHV